MTYVQTLSFQVRVLSLLSVGMRVRSVYWFLFDFVGKYQDFKSLPLSVPAKLKADNCIS